MKAMLVQRVNKSGKPLGMIEVYDMGGGRVVRVEYNPDGSWVWRFGKFVPREYINEGA